MIDTTTKKGLELARKLAPAIGYTRHIDETCSLICRHATTYSHIQELWCNEEMSDRRTKYLEDRESKLEKRITWLIESLPDTDEGPWKVKFGGDPRGATVKIVDPGGKLGDSWGDRADICVPGS